MALRDANLVKDAFFGGLGGVDSSMEPSLISPDRLAWAVNAVCRGGFPATRPRFSRHTLIFVTTEQEEWFKNNPFQGDYTWDSGLTTIVVVSIGGRIFTISPTNNFTVNEITPTSVTTTAGNFNAPAVGSNVTISVASGDKIFAGYPIFVNGKLYVVVSVTGNVVTATNKTDTPAALVSTGATVVYLDPNSPNQPLVWMEPGDKYLFIQNDLDRCIIYDGTNARRSAADEVPVGSAMVFNEEIGRLCVAVNGNDIAIGDVINGPTGVTKFTEGTYLSEGGKFRVPRKYGRITGATMLANLDRSNGQGPMIFFGERGFSTFNLPPNRSQWKNLTYPVQINMPIQFGATSQDSIVLVNGDAYYRANDGLRSFKYAIMEFQGTGNTPISTELTRVLKHDDDNLLLYARAMLFDNRLLFTTNPSRGNNGVYHRGLCSLDFNPSSRLGQKSPPAYDGVLTGLRVSGLATGTFAGTVRAFIFAQNPDTDANEFWEMHKISGYDNATSRIPCSIETRAFICGKAHELKEAHALEVWVDQLKGTVSFTAEYRPDSYPCWMPWGTTEICVKEEDCNEDDCKILQVFNMGYKTRFHFNQPPDAAESLDDKPARNAYDHQIRLSWTGQARIRKILFKARPIQEEVNPSA